MLGWKRKLISDVYTTRSCLPAVSLQKLSSFNLFNGNTMRSIAMIVLMYGNVSREIKFFFLGEVVASSFICFQLPKLSQRSRRGITELPHSRRKIAKPAKHPN